MRVTSPDKLYFPEVGLTKLDVVEYVLAVGDGIFAALRDRPGDHGAVAGRLPPRRSS